MRRDQSRGRGKWFWPWLARCWICRTGRPAKARSGRSRRTYLPVVPNIDQKLPIVSDLLPDRYVSPTDFMRRRTFGLQTECTNLARRERSQRLDIESRDLRIPNLVRHIFPHCLDGGPALHHARVGRKCRRIIGIERTNAGEIALVEELHHLAFTASISAFSASAGVIRSAKNTMAMTIIRRISS